MDLCKDNAVLGLTVTKAIKGTQCDLETAIAFAKIHMNNIGFSPINYFLGKILTYLPIGADLPPNSRNKSPCEQVQENLNTLHFARENFIKADMSEKFKKAMKHNRRSHTNGVYQQGDIIFYKRGISAAWKGPGTAVSQVSANTS